MLDDTLKSQLQQYMGLLRQPLRLIASLDDSATSQEMRGLLDDIVAAGNGKIALDASGSDARRPSFVIAREGESTGVRFAGLPLGHEFTSLVLALLWTGGHPPKVEQDVIDSIKAIEGEHDFDVYMSLTCHNCPDVVQALSLMAILNPNIRTTVIEGGAFQAEVEQRQVMAVPMVFRGGEMFDSGRMSVEQIVARLDTGAAKRDAARLSAKDAFDVLVVGGGPAGSAAAIYAARKGIRTGVAAERFGGQVLDTMAIENFISVKETEGPKLASALEEHVKQYDVDIMNLQRATELVPAGGDGLVEVKLENGGSLKSRTVILSTGARWRQMNVPGEDQYRNKGVAYCPHCDGPLFKGKRVAVIGGGNSGVEAAIDLAGIVAHVTLFEFDSKLRADQVLQDKLRSLSNVTVITSALTTEVLGDGQKVTGLVYTDRVGGDSHRVELEGIFVQIGLLPNTEWLKGTVELSNRGEIVIDDRGQTNVPGVFAAGDCTTVPYKQIIIAMGAGATASLSAFDHLIRTSAPAPAAAVAEASCPAPAQAPLTGRLR